MKKTIFALATALMAGMTMTAQTLNVEVGQVTYQIPAEQAGEMTYEGGQTLTIMDKTFTLTDISQMYIDDTEVKDSTVTVSYTEEGAQVFVAGNVAQYLTVDVNGGHVTMAQDSELPFEITYNLSGESSDGEFALSGNFKATVELRGLTLTNPSGAAINITNGKRIALSVKNGTVNTLTDGADGKQKGALYCKGHLELKGKGTLNVYGNTAHAIKSGDYTSMKNCTVNILAAVKDGISANEYFLMESGTLTISGVGDDGIQADLDGTENTGETKDHEDEDSGNIYLEGGTLNITVTADAAKGMKAAGDVKISGGKLTITQTGSIVVDGDDISYPTSIKTDGNINITGGTITINNTADGGKGMSADGELTIDETKATVTIDITANGKGGTAETTSSGTETETASYKVYVTLPSSSGGGPGGGPGGQGNNVWKTVYLYKSDGTLVQQLTSTVTKSSTTFYYYDFKASDSDTYYFKSDDYTNQGGGPNGGSGTSYTIKSETFSGPTTGSDIYYSITNSYTTSGTTRTYKLSNVTSTYSGSSDTSEEEGTGYNAAGLKADGNLTISGGTITIKNSGAMSKSIKSKATTTIDGGNITLTPSGAMQVINSDASYSIGVKTVDFIQNDGTLTIKASGQAGRGISATNITTNGGTLSITNSGAGVTGSSDDYTAKGMKADTSVKLNAGTITITMSGTGGKGIKSKGYFTEGTSDGEGPVLTVTTTGSKLNASSGGGGGMGGWGGMGGQTSGGGSAKAIKVQGTITLYGGTTEISTATDGAEGLESKTSSATSIVIKGGKHYFKCYDDCINSAGSIVFDGGVTVCYSNGNDAVDSNYGRSGAITIGDGAVFAYTSKGAPEEGLDCDNNSYIQITGTGIGISAGAAQGGGGSSGNTISNAKQGYKFVTSNISYQTGRYYTLSDESGNNLVTYSFAANLSSSLALFTATGMKSGSKYYVKYSTTAPTDATTAWHGLYIGSSAAGTTSVTSFTAQ